MNLQPDINRLGKSRTDRMIGGVCAGFAEWTQTPSWLWRAGFVFVALWAGTGLLAYLILWIFMPFNTDAR